MRDSAATLIESAPEIECRGGLFYIADQQGIRVMRAATFFQSIANAVEASRGYRAEGAKIIPLHAASHSGKSSK